jgi:hypothetical protein
MKGLEVNGDVRPDERTEVRGVLAERVAWAGTPVETLCVNPRSVESDNANYLRAKLISNR